MRRICALFLALALLFSLAACQTNAPEPTPTPSPSAEPDPTPTPDPTPEPSPTLAPPGEDGELLMAFTRGESEAAVDENFYGENVWDGTLPEMEPFTAQELFQHLESREYNEDAPQGEMSYTLMKTLGGREMLVLHYIPAAVMGANMYLVFGVFDGQVRLIFATAFGYRSYTELCQGLVFSGGGSMGAGAHVNEAGYIDDTGHYRELYYSETLVDLWVLMHTDIDMDDSETAGVMCTLLSLDGKEYYELETYEEGGTTPADPAAFAQVREQLNAQGREETDSVERLISDAYAAHGLSEGAQLYDGPWLPLELDR